MNDLARYFTLLQQFDNQGNEQALDLCHNLFMMGALLSMKPEDVLELGIGSAYVTISLIHGLKYNGKGRLTCVENWNDAGGMEPQDIVASLRNSGVNVVSMDEGSFVATAPTDGYDFLISDADHLRSGTWIDQHLRIVRNGGFMFFHDTNQPEKFPTLALIEKRVKELELYHYHFKESSRRDERCERGWLFAINRK